MNVQAKHIICSWKRLHLSMADLEPQQHFWPLLCGRVMSHCVCHSSKCSHTAQHLCKLFLCFHNKTNEGGTHKAAKVYPTYIFKSTFHFEIILELPKNCKDSRVPTYSSPSLP